MAQRGEMGHRRGAGGWVGEGQRPQGPERVRCLVPLHPTPPGPRDLSFSFVLSGRRKGRGGPTEGGARGHHDRWTSPVLPLHFTVGGWRGRTGGVEGGRRGEVVSKDLAEASSTGGKSREAGELWVPSPEEGRGLLLPLTCRAQEEPQPRGRAGRGFPDGKSWRAGPGRALHCRWGASSPPLPGQVQAAIRRAPERCSAPRNARLPRGRPRPSAPSPPPPPLLGARLLQLLRISANPGGQPPWPGSQRR